MHAGATGQWEVIENTQTLDAHKNQSGYQHATNILVFPTYNTFRDLSFTAFCLINPESPL